MSKKFHKKRPARTLKEKKFVKAYLKSGNGTQAALEAYDTTNPATAAVIATQNLNKLNISDILDRAGVTDAKLAQVMSEGLEANRVISANIVLTKSDDPTVKDQKANTMTKDFIDVPDHAVRHKFMETAYKLKGQLTTNQQPLIDNRKMYIVLPPEKDHE